MVQPRNRRRRIQEEHDLAAAQDPAALHAPAPQGRRREGSPTEDGNHRDGGNVQDAETAVQEAAPSRPRCLHRKPSEEPDGRPQHRHAAPKMLRPSLPVRGRRGSNPRSPGRAPGPELRQALHGGQAPEATQGARQPHLDFHPDDARPGHPGGFHGDERLQVLPNRRKHHPRRPRGIHRRLQRAGQRKILLHPVDPCGRSRNQPANGRRLHPIRFRLESAAGSAGPGSVPSFGAKEARERLPAGQRKHHRRKNRGARPAEAQARCDGRAAGPAEG
mmetsp:Transcript_5634/g.14076  ORF Transcript_5634/g.14076 Transcript_5634/m.14076 type:complete len:275 (+) Transcript_5634:2116-2940(+)